MVGRVIKGKYKIYDIVGEGGFATVYLGRNMETNEIVAVKVLAEQLTREPRYIERFRREAELAERLRHPNIVRVLDHGVEEGVHFLVMQFVEGLTLDKILSRKGPLPIDEVLAYVEQTCAGLQAAHDAGVVHRDIKPANLMVTPDGTVKIMDFGIARTESMTNLTQTGVFIGTPRYISPEMAIGIGVDIRSDLYAVGLLTYEILAGVPPFDADNPWAVLRQQIEDQPASLRKVRPDVPAWLNAIISRAIAKEPAKRFQTPDEMLAALKEQTATPRRAADSGSLERTAAAVQPSDVSGAPSGVISPHRRERKKGQRGLVLALAGAAMVVTLGLIALLVFGLGGGKATPTVDVAAVSKDTPASATAIAVITQVVTSAPREVVPPLSTEASPTRPSSTVQPTETLTPEEDSGTRQPAAQPTETPTSVPTLPATATQAPTDTPRPTAKPTQAPTNTPRPTEPPTSPPPPAVTGRIAFSVGGTLYVVDVQSKNTLFTVAGMRQPDFRRDGVEILADGLRNPAAVVNINARTGAIIREQTVHTDDYHPFWSPDGTRFTYDSLHHGLGAYTMLYTQSLTDSRPQPEVTLYYSGQQIRGHSPVWMHDDMIAFTGCDYWPGGSGGSKCGIYFMPSWSDRPVLIHPGSTDMRATDNHGNQLTFMSQETGNWEVYIMPNRGGEATNLSNSPSSQDGLGTFSPDGKRVAFVSNRGGGWAVWVVNLDGSGATKLLSLPGQPGAPWYEDSMSWGP